MVREAPSIDISALRRMIRISDLYTYQGRIDKVMGLTVEATGLVCNIGDICEIQVDDTHKVVAEVVGLKGSIVQLMPYQELDGIGAGSLVVNTGDKLEIGVGPELVGRTIDALGNPIDGGPAIRRVAKYPINGVHSNPMERPPISQVMELGVKAIDGLLTMGKGQRMGIFAGSGVGVHRAGPGAGGPCPQRGGGGHLRPAGHDALQMRPHRHRHRRILP